MKAQDILRQKYGDPNEEYQAKYCVLWNIQKDFPWFKDIINAATGKPVEKIFINRDFKDKLFIALTAITQAKVYGEIKIFNGCYQYRKSRTTNLLSIHAWAAAWDLDAFEEKLGQTTTNWSDTFLKCMRDAGIFWGGDFHGTKDPMHFALVDG